MKYRGSFPILLSSQVPAIGEKTKIESGKWKDHLEKKLYQRLFQQLSFSSLTILANKPWLQGSLC